MTDDQWRALVDMWSSSKHKVIPAENIVAAFQGCRGTVLAVSTNSTEAQVFLEALEQGLDGVVLKIEDMDDIIKLKGYFDRRNEARSQLLLTKATVSKVEVVGMGDRVCVDLCSIMRPGEGLLVGSYARGMFLVHSECLETNYIASKPFRVNAGPVHAYVAVPGDKTSYLSELRSGREVIIVDQNGLWRTAIVGRVNIEPRPLILVEAKKKEKYKDTEPTAIDLFKDTHCSKKIGFSEPVKNAIAAMEAIVAEPVEEGQHPKSSTEVVIKVLPKSSFLRNMGLQSATKTSERGAVSAQVQDLQAQLETEKQESAGLREEVGILKAQAKEYAQEIDSVKKAQYDTQQLVRQLLNFNQSQVTPP